MWRICGEFSTEGHRALESFFVAWIYLLSEVAPTISGRCRILTLKVPGIYIARADCHEEDAFLLVQSVVMGYCHIDSRLADGIGRCSVKLYLVDEIRVGKSGR